MARLYHTFGDIEGKLGLLRIECIKCERKSSAPDQILPCARLSGTTASSLIPVATL